MSLTRRTLLRLTATAAVASGARVAAAAPAAYGDWEDVRALFPLAGDRVHMSAMLITAHPAPVAEAIERHRRALDEAPVEYLEENGSRLTEAAREAAGARMGAPADQVALTESTTQGVGLVYTGLDLAEGQEILTSTEDYYVTHESLRLAAARTGASVRQFELGEWAEASPEALAERVLAQVRPETRVLALTWVNSGSGLKLPAALIGEGLREINAGRAPEGRVLFGLDAVHGFAVEPEGLDALGADFMMAGCHKWLFGPRGTGAVAFSREGLDAVRPAIPTFDDPEVFSAWYVGREPRFANSGPRMTPGGFKAFEHRWALAEAFALHDAIGRERVAERTHSLAEALKEGLAGIAGVTLVTPRGSGRSAGIVAFDLDGMTPRAATDALRERGVIASVAPYPRPLVRLTPSVRNSEAEVERVLAAVREVARPARRGPRPRP